MSKKSEDFPPNLKSFSQKLSIAGPLSGKAFPDQTISGRINISGETQCQTYANKQHANGQEERRLVHVDLDNSQISAAAGMLDQDTIRGYYVESIEYKVWLQKLGEAPNPDKALDHWSIFTESPNTSNLTGSISSSISWGLNASAGVFGDVPTGNLGANLGVSNSHQHTLSDFTFLQRSTSKVLHHRIYLSQCQDGSPYDNSASLIDQWQNPFADMEFRQLPGMAKSNVPLIGQAVWMNEDDAGLFDRLTAHVAVSPHWCLVEGKQDGQFHRRASGLGGTHYYSVDIDFGVISPSADLTILSADYGAGTKKADVTTAVASNLVAGRLSFDVNNANLGGDPAPNVSKELHVAYSYKGKSYDVRVAEGKHLSIVAGQSATATSA
jgi:hypothetical protein